MSTAAGSGSAAGGVSVAPPIPPGRRAVLYAVRELGDPTVDDVAAELGITISGARQQLNALAEHGLIGSHDLPREGQRGRPRITYHVTDLADALFPKAYGALTNELLGYLADDGEETIERLFSRRRDHRIAAASARLDPLPTLREKVDELARILDEDGYLATAHDTGDGAYRVVEHNCAIVAVARRYGQACVSEIDFIRTVLADTEVERVSHIVEGSHHCAYEIRPARRAA